MEMGMGDVPFDGECKCGEREIGASREEDVGYDAIVSALPF